MVGIESEIIDSIIMEGARIGDNCSLRGTIIGENTVIGDNCELVDCVIGDDVHLTAGTILSGQRLSN